MNWVITRNKVESCKYLQKIPLRDGFDFLFSLDKSSYYYNEVIHSGIFIFGYCLPRISSSHKLLSPEQLFLLHLEHKDSFFKSIKGIFTIVLIENGLFSVFNDHLGLSKYFYSGSTDIKAISNSIVQIKKLKLHIKLNPNNILEYYIFNYLLNGNTFFDEIFYSKPATMIFLDDNRCVKRNCYFTLEENLRGLKSFYKEAQVIRNAADVWMSIIDQYQRYLCNSNVSLTLTAGLDSRIILGGFLKYRHSRFDTFTFGNENSSDVYYAKQIALKINIKHNHLFPEKTFFTNYAEKAEEVYKKGESLVSIYRAHRLDAYKKVKKISETIMMGLGGSDLVRGSGYDGLIVSRAALHCWQRKSLESYLTSHEVTSHLNKIGFQSQNYLLDNKNKYTFINNPILYLFNVTIPLHFGQDILINKNSGIKTMLPFLDVDYIDFIKETPYFNIMDYKNYKIYDIIRRARGLYYSAKLSNELNRELSCIDLGKGYTPNDIISYFPWMIIKDILVKKLRRKKIDDANFAYGDWYLKYLINYFKMGRIEETGLNSKEMLSELLHSKGNGDELVYLDYTKAVNIDLALRT